MARKKQKKTRRKTTKQKQPGTFGTADVASVANAKVSGPGHWRSLAYFWLGASFFVVVSPFAEPAPVFLFAFAFLFFSFSSLPSFPFRPCLVFAFVFFIENSFLLVSVLLFPFRHRPFVAGIVILSFLPSFRSFFLSFGPSFGTFSLVDSGRFPVARVQSNRNLIQSFSIQFAFNEFKKKTKKQTRRPWNQKTKNNERKQQNSNVDESSKFERFNGFYWMILGFTGLNWV